MRIALICLALGMGCEEAASVPQPPNPPAPMTANEHIKQMIATYSAATSYSDHGTVVTRVEGNPPRGGTLSFETAFIRGGRFRFEFGERDDQYVLWSDGEHAYSYWPAAARIGQQVTTDYGPHLERVIAGATGVSSGTAHTIPTMLMPQLGEAAYMLSLLNLRVDGTEEIDGHHCVRIIGNEPRGDVMTLWIDRDLHLLRRIASGYRFKTFEAHYVTTYEPSLNTPIDTRRLEPPDLVTFPPQPPTPIPTIGVVFAPESARIEKIVDGRAAARAGLRVGDEVTAVDGNPIKHPIEVYIFKSKIGAQLVLTVSRAGTTLDVPVTVEAAH
jgi:outer membrane lipoprotein-sorting protein